MKLSPEQKHIILTELGEEATLKDYLIVEKCSKW